MRFRPSLLICALPLSPVAFSRAVPADAQIVIGHPPLAHSALPATPPHRQPSLPPLSLPSAAPMSVPSAPGPDDDSDPFLALVEGDPDQGASWHPTIGVIRTTNHRKWGFLVYRVYYGDDVAWERFMYILNRVTDNFVRRAGKPYIMPFLDWTEMQDRAAFDGASKDDIREHFRTWVRTRSVERDGPGVEGREILISSPRYQACLYVDKEAMESATMTEIPYPVNPTGFYLDVKGQVVLIDGQLQDEWMPPPPELTQEDLDEMEEEGWEEEQYTPIDGNTDFDVGWMYVELMFASVAYDTMCEGMDTWSQRWFYKRPPTVWNAD